MDRWVDFSVPRIDATYGTAALDAVSALVVVAEVSTGNVVHVNAMAQQVVGWPEEELLGHRWKELVDARDRQTVRAALTSPSGPTLGFETALATRQGGRRRVLWSVAFTGGTPMIDGHLVLTGIDVTLEDRTHGLFSHLIRGSTIPALVGTDTFGRITLYNSAAERIVGRPASAMLGRILPFDLFEPAEVEERAGRLGVPADLELLTRDLSKLDRRRSNLDLGALDRRRRPDDEGRYDEDGHDERRQPERRGERRGREDRGRTRGPQARDWTLIRNGGERFTASLVVVPMTGSDDQPIGYLGIAEDVTEQRRSRNLLVAGLEKEAEAVRRLRELDRAKSDFVATVSHELRTPITSILGYVELLLDATGDEQPEQRAMLETVRRNGDRLRALADNLVTLSSFEAGEFTMHCMHLDLCVLLRQAEEALRPLLAERRLVTSFRVPPYPVMVDGDGAHLERVVFNLLSNALKFTEDGGRIECNLSTDGVTVVMEVADTGIGVPAAEQGQLFTKFFRSSTAQKRAIQGSGMGLAVVAAIVQRHLGEISVDSAEGRGTSVKVSLPLLPGLPLLSAAAADGRAS